MVLLVTSFLPLPLMLSDPLLPFSPLPDDVLMTGLLFTDEVDALMEIPLFSLTLVFGVLPPFSFRMDFSVEVSPFRRLSVKKVGLIPPIIGLACSFDGGFMTWAGFDWLVLTPRLITFSLPAPEFLTDVSLAATFSCFPRFPNVIPPFPMLKNLLSPLLAVVLAVTLLLALTVGALLTGLMLLFPPLLLTFSLFSGNFFSLSTFLIGLLTGLLITGTFSFFARLSGWTLITFPTFPEGLLLSRFPLVTVTLLGAPDLPWLLTGLLLADPALWLTFGTFIGEFCGFLLITGKLLTGLLLIDPLSCLTLFVEVTGALFPTTIDLLSPFPCFANLGDPFPFLL